MGSMKLQLPFQIPPLRPAIRHTDKILLTGSCFTEHIAGRLSVHKFRTMQNPHGILFNPLSVARSLEGYATGKLYREDELFYLNELWGSWDHHTRFSHIDKSAALAGINASQDAASAFIRDADWIVVTLGSAFQYYLTPAALRHTSVPDSQRVPADGTAAYPVANNHRAPGGWFEKRLLGIAEITEALTAAIQLISHHNPKVQFLFTISPVRHIRDGVVDNNRSKSRLIEAVHTLCDTLVHCHYFPAYELVIDVLRDYRFYDIDLVHPNYAATESVWDAFVQACISPDDYAIMESLKDISVARSHLPRFPQTEAHRRFISAYADKIAALSITHPYVDLSEERAYFKM